MNILQKLYDLDSYNEKLTVELENCIKFLMLPVVARSTEAVFTVAAKKVAFFKAALFSRLLSIFTVAAKKAAFLRAI
jgi:hypothetical protein